MSEEVELMLLAEVRSLESEVGRMAKRLAEATVKLVSLKAERDTLVHMLVSEFDWSDTSYLHAMMHVENAIRNLRADARAAQAERDQLREELARLHRLAPTGTYTVSLPHEQEIQRLSGEKYTWQARAELAEEVANGLREALRAAEKRELEALAQLNEREADVETLQTHVEVQREALQKTSKAVAKLVVPVTKIAELLEHNGCDCECDHCWEDHDETCERCLACLIEEAILDKKENER